MRKNKFFWSTIFAVLILKAIDWRDYAPSILDFSHHWHGVATFFLAVIGFFLLDKEIEKFRKNFCIPLVKGIAVLAAIISILSTIFAFYHIKHNNLQKTLQSYKYVRLASPTLCAFYFSADEEHPTTLDDPPKSVILAPEKEVLLTTIQKKNISTVPQENVTVFQEQESSLKLKKAMEEKELQTLEKENLHLNLAVEKELVHYFTRSNGLGVYYQQFTALVKLGSNAADILEDMLCDDDHKFHTISNASDKIRIRVLAGYALTKFSFEKTRRTQLINKLLPLRNYPHMWIQESIIFVLYILGEEQYIASKLKYYSDEIDRAKIKLKDDSRDDKIKRSISALYFQKAWLYYLMGREGIVIIEFFEKSVEYDHLNSHAQYNIACTYAAMNQRQLAIQNLQKAVTLGYDDWQWMAKDQELDNIRHLFEFQNIIESLRDSNP